MNKIVEIKNHSKNSLLLTWVINNICTNNCSYCPADLHSGSNHHYDWNHAEDFINQCFELYDSVQCNVSGGEPTVSPFFQDLVKIIYNKGGAVNVTTNLVKKLDWWIEIAPYIGAVSASYHAEHMDSNSDKEYIDKVKQISSMIDVNARIMMHPDNWDQCNRIFQTIADECPWATVEMVRILPTFGTEQKIKDINYTPEQNQILAKTQPIVRGAKKKHIMYRPFRINSSMKLNDGTTMPFGFDVAAKMLNDNLTDFFGWKCSVGLESLFVHYNGSVLRGNCGVGGVIGNIITGIKWPETQITCDKKFCLCLADVLLSKEKLSNT